jgi:hypothetical protein
MNPDLEELLAMQRSGTLTESGMLASLALNFDAEVIDAALGILSVPAQTILESALVRAANNEIFTLMPILLVREQRLRIKTYVESKGWKFEPKIVLQLSEALELVKRAGLEIPEDIRFVCSEWVGGGDAFLFGGWSHPSNGLIGWKSFYSGDSIPVLIHPRCLDRASHACETILHAVMLLRELRARFEQNGEMPFEELAKVFEKNKLGTLYMSSHEAGRLWLKEHGL